MVDCVQTMLECITTVKGIHYKRGQVTTIFTMHMVKSYQGIVCQYAQWSRGYKKKSLEIGRFLGRIR